MQYKIDNVVLFILHLNLRINVQLIVCNELERIRKDLWEHQHREKGKRYDAVV